MNSAIQELLDFFGLLPDTSAWTLGDALVYMVMAIFAVIAIYLLFSFVYGCFRFFLGFGRDKL